MNINPKELFYSDNKLFEFDATVVKVIPHGEFVGVVLDKTGFFPEAGGQSADEGTVNGVKVIDVQVTPNGIEHYVKADFKVNDRVIGILDAQSRLTKERNHTGEHIVSSVVHKYFGYDNVGFHMGKTQMDVDFNGAFTDEDLAFIEREANAVVMANVEVKCYFASAEELSDVEYRSKLELDNPRIVEITGYDYCACCAPHVSYTGEVGYIKIANCYRNRGNSRLTLLCQKDAVKYAQNICIDAQKSGALLSVKPYDVSKAIAKQIDEIARLKRENVELQKTVAQSIIRQIHDVRDYIVVFCSSFAVKDVVNYGLTKSAKGVCAFTQTSDGYSYMLASNGADMREISSELNRLFNGAGGGKPNAVQGRIKATEKQIKDYFDNKE